MLSHEVIEVEQWKIKRLVQSLESARGNGTSMISLILPPKDQISRAAKMLNNELGTAAHIKSRVSRLSVLGAITSVQQKLKLYSRVPDNGLIIYSGTIVTPEGKEKKLVVDLEPFKPINTSLYLCDNRFHLEVMKELLESDEKYGFIVMDGNGCLFGTLSGNTRTVLHKFSVDLPKKHGRGGQSALRFARLRDEKRHNYIRKVTETATQHFIMNDRPCISGLVLAGSADFKTQLQSSELFDQRLKSIVIKIVDVAYGGENGFNQAIELCSDTLASVKFIQEKQIISQFFKEIEQDSGKYCFGTADTMQALELGAVERLIVWENFEIMRYELLNISTGAREVKLLRPDQNVEAIQLIDKEMSETMEIIDAMPFLEWLVNNYSQFGATLEIVSDKSQEGSQFCNGFGGLGAVLRYQVDFLAMEYDSDD